MRCFLNLLPGPKRTHPKPRKTETACVPTVPLRFIAPTDVCGSTSGGRSFDHAEVQLGRQWDRGVHCEIQKGCFFSIFSG